MAVTPGKLSLQYKRLIRANKNSPQTAKLTPTAEAKASSNTESKSSSNHDVIVISSSEDEKENTQNNARKKKTGSSLSSRNSRRNSTILAGNLTILESDDDEERPSVLSENLGGPSTAANLSSRERISQRVGGAIASRFTGQTLQEITEDEDENDLITEDETNFYSCDDESKDGSPLNTGGVLNTVLSTRSQNPSADNTLTSHSGGSSNTGEQPGSKKKSSQASSSSNQSGSKQESLRLVLSESSLSEAHYSKTPGIVLASQNQSLASENFSPNRTPTNNNRDKVLSAVKGSRIFSSVGKGLSERRHAGRVLVAGSDSDEDSESDPAGRVLSRKLSFNKFRNSPRIPLANSDEEELPSPRLPAFTTSPLPSPSHLSNSKIQRVNSWLSGVSPVPQQRRDSTDSLLDSPQNDNFNNSCITEESEVKDISRNDLSLEDGLSQGTSKAAGSQNSQSFSQGTSKAGGSWSESNQSSKAQAMDSSSAGTSNPGEKPKQPHQNSYPSSEFLRNFIQTFEAPTTAASTRKEPGEANSNIKLGIAHRTTTAEDRNGGGFSDDVHTGEGIRRTDVSQGASNTAVSLTPSNSDKLSSQATSKAGGSWNASAASGTDQSSFLCQGTSKAGGGNSFSDSSKAGGNSFINSSKAGGSSFNNSSKADGGSSFNNSDFVPLNHYSINSSQASTRGNIIYGNESLDVPEMPPMPPPPPRAVATKTKGKSTQKPKSTPKSVTKKHLQNVSTRLENLTIDNSVNAVKAWTPKAEEEYRSQGSQVSSQVSERVEKHRDKSSSEDGDLDKFLSNLKSSRAKPSSAAKQSNLDDDDFVVPDHVLEEDSDSSSADSPAVSLKDRILKRRNLSTAASPNFVPAGDRKNQRPKSSSSITAGGGRRKQRLDDDDSDEEELSVRPGRSGRSRIKANVISSDDSDDKQDLPSPNEVVKTKPKRNTTVKKNVIRSDSESDSSTPFKPSESSSDYSPVRTAKPSKPTGVLTETPRNFRPTNPGKKSTARRLQGADVVGSPTTLTFLSSLTIDTPKYRCHPDALQYVTNFKKKKEELAKRLYHLYNKEIFEGCLPADMEISWNVRLTKTAGLCYSKRYRNKFNVEMRSSRIELSSKVLDSGDRLRDTLIHEMCHAASWIISGYRDGHGPLWRTWAEKAMARFKELPVIDRCHSYQIRTKYSYVCQNCGYTIGRHSKSLDTEKKVCGHCHGRFQLVLNANSVSNKENDAKVVPGQTQQKTPNAFALFVKENYKHHKKEGVSHKDVMAVLSQEFKKFKLNK